MNKKVFQVGILIIVIATLLPFTTAAFSGAGNKPMGGKVTMVAMPGVTCAAGAGPFFIIPYNGAPAGPYIIIAPTKGVPKPGGHILGLYKLVPNVTNCYTNTTPPVPVAVFPVTAVYGVSR